MVLLFVKSAPALYFPAAFWKVDLQLAGFQFSALLVLRHCFLYQMSVSNFSISVIRINDQTMLINFQKHDST